MHFSNKDNNQINLCFEFSSAKLHSILTLPPAVPPTHSMKVYFQPYKLSYSTGVFSNILMKTKATALARL